MDVLRHVLDVFATAPRFARAGSWDGRIRLGRCWYFEDASQRLAVRVSIEPAISSVDVSVHRIQQRPTGSDPFTGPGVSHAFTYGDEHALVHRLSVIVGNLARHADLVADDREDAYRAAFDSGREEREHCRAQLPGMLRAAIIALDPDVDQQVVVPHGIRFRLIKLDAYASEHGMVPAGTRLVLEREGEPRHVPESLLPSKPIMIEAPPPDSIVSRVELAAIVDEHVSAGLAEIAAGRAWNVMTGLVVTMRWHVEASKELVLALARRRARTGPFASFLDALPEPAWRSVYDGVATRADPVALLRGQVDRAPAELKVYLELAKAYEARGDLGHSQLWLGLGYLRAKKMKTVARGKLEAARRAAPHLAELAAGFEELERLCPDIKE